jgi:uncharacterized DUF497 family protein
MKIEFDPTKDVANKEKHGISLAMAEFLDWEVALIVQDNRFDYGELRFIAISPLDGRVYTAVFTHRDPNIRIISLRKANPKEVTEYVHYNEKR